MPVNSTMPKAEASTLAAPGGRGGVFTGGSSQIRLMPSTSATHPTNGLAGDLFLDAGNRLWLCKGTTAWVQVA